MSCRKWEIKISRWHEGNLGKRDEESVLRHLRECPQCREMEARFRDVERMLSNCPEVPVPRFLHEKIVLHVSEYMRQRSDDSIFTLALIRYRFLRHALVLGLSTLGVLLGVAAGSSLTHSLQPPNVAAPYDLISAALPNGTGPDSTFDFIWKDD